MWAVIVTFVLFFVGQYETQAGVTVLRAKEPSKLYLNESKISTRLSMNGTDKQETLILTRDKKLEDYWRKENGELVKLIPVDERELQIARRIESLNNAIYTESTKLGEGVPNSKVDARSSSSKSTGSSRQKRTFWPFTSLFGYDYYPPVVGPPVFGPGMIGGPFGRVPPFGGFGGVGFLPPPPPFLGLEFTLGL